MRNLSVLGAGLLALGCSASANEFPDSEPVFTPCRIGATSTAVAAECTSIDVPFTHNLTLPGSSTTDKPSPESISLAIAKIPARTNPAADDPITLLAGGPGQSAQDSWPQIKAAFYPLLGKRDVYLIDQRGTGKSHRLDCPASPAKLKLDINLAEIGREAATCYAAQPVPTQWFTTSVAVRDLDYVRSALGIKVWNLYGVSYGTRVALHYLRHYPEHTRRVIIDAVVAPQKPIGPEIPVDAQNSLNALLDRCQDDQFCAEAFPDLTKKTEGLFRSLKRRPRTVQFENISRGSLDSMTLNDKHLAAIVRLLSYSSYGTAILPSMLYDAATNGNLAPFARQTAIQLEQLSDTLANGMHAAVICTEDAPFIDSLASGDGSAGTYLGNDLVDAILATCNEWPTGVKDKDFHAPVISDVPVLALSGAVDPITPPAYAEQAIESLTNATHIVNPHQGHTQAPLGCIPTVMMQFIDNEDADDLNLTCLERLSPPAIFIDANGPAP